MEIVKFDIYIKNIIIFKDGLFINYSDAKSPTYPQNS